MYPTDWIYKAIFNFKDKDSPVEHFEFLGYEGVIFINLTGSIIINLLIPATFWARQQIVKRLAYRFQNVKCIRTIAIFAGNTNLMSVIT